MINLSKIKRLTPDISLAVLLLVLAAAIASKISPESIMYKEDAVDFFLPAIHDILSGNLATGLARDTARGPGFPLLISGLAALFGQPDFIFSVGGAISALLSLAFSFILLRRAGFGMIAFWASVATVFAGVTPIFFGELGADAYWWFFIAAAGLIFFRKTNSHRSLFFVGALLGASATLRLPSLFLPAALMLIIIVRARSDGEVFKNALLHVAALFAGWALLFVPLIFYTSSVLGISVYSYNMFNLVPEIGIYARGATNFFGLIKNGLAASPIGFPFRLLAEIFFFAPVRVLTGLTFGHPIGLIAFIAGVPSLLLLSNKKRLAEYAIFGLALWAPLSLAFFQPRFYLPLIPFIAATMLSGLYLPFLGIGYLIKRPAFTPKDRSAAAGPTHPIRDWTKIILVLLPALAASFFIYSKSDLMLIHQFSQTSRARYIIQIAKELSLPLPIYTPMHYSPTYFARRNFGDDKTIAYEGLPPRARDGSVIAIDNLYHIYMTKSQMRQRLAELNRPDFQFDVPLLNPASENIPDYLEPVWLSPGPITAAAYRFSERLRLFPSATTINSAPAPQLCDHLRQTLSRPGGAADIEIHFDGEAKPDRLLIWFEEPVDLSAFRILVFDGNKKDPKSFLKPSLLYIIPGKKSVSGVISFSRPSAGEITLSIPAEVFKEAKGIREIILYGFP